MSDSALHASAFHVGEFGGYFSVADGEDVDAADVPGLAVAQLVIRPENDGVIAADDDVFGIEACVGIAGEPGAPEFDDGGFSLDAAAVGGGGRVFEDGVISQELGQAVGIVTVEGIVEMVDGGAGGLLRGWHGNLRRGKESREQGQRYYESGEAHGVLQAGKVSG